MEIIIDITSEYNIIKYIYYIGNNYYDCIIDKASFPKR